MMIYVWLVVWNMNFIFHFIYGMSSETHWRTPSFFKMVKLHHQPAHIQNLRPGDHQNLFFNWYTDLFFVSNDGIYIFLIGHDHHDLLILFFSKNMLIKSWVFPGILPIDGPFLGPHIMSHIFWVYRCVRLRILLQTDKETILRTRVLLRTLTGHVFLIGLLPCNEWM